MLKCYLEIDNANLSVQLFFKKKFGRHQSFFMGPLIPLFWTSGDVCPWFQSQGDPLLACFIALCNGFLRFSYGVTPADLLAASMAAEPFL